MEQATLEGAVLKNVDFSGANLSEAILSGADLSGGILENANLGKVNFAFAIIIDASLTSAILDGTNLEGAKLCGSSLVGASLRDAFLGDISYDGADFRGAILGGAVLPEGLRSMLGQHELSGILSEGVKAVDPVMREYWDVIVQLRPHMLRAAQLVNFYTRADPEDIVSSTMIRLASKKYVELMLQMSDQERRQFVKTVIQRNARYFAYLSVYDGVGVDADPSGEEIAAEEGKDEDQDISDIPAEQADELVAVELDKTIIRRMQVKDNVDLLTTAVDPDILELLSLPLDSAESFDILMSDIRSILSRQVARLIELHFVEGYSLEEIAGCEGKTIKYIRRMISTGVEIIREYLVDAGLRRNSAVRDNNPPHA